MNTWNVRDVGGYISGTESQIRVDLIELKLSRDDAWALCNVLSTTELDRCQNIETTQRDTLKKIGMKLGVMIDHYSKNNLGKFTMLCEDPPTENN